MYVVFRIDARAYGLKDFSVLFVFQTQNLRLNWVQKSNSPLYKLNSWTKIEDFE